MKIRLIKAGRSPAVETHSCPPVEVPIINTVRSWVREFQLTRADRARLDFERISKPGKA